MLRFDVSGKSKLFELSSFVVFCCVHSKLLMLFFFTKLNKPLYLITIFVIPQANFDVLPGLTADQTPTHLRKCKIE